MNTTAQRKQPFVPKAQAIGKAPAIKHQPRSKRFYFDVGLGSVCLSGIDTGGAYCLLEVSLAPGMAVPRHTHTREDEVYFVLAGELEVTVGEKGDVFVAYTDGITESENACAEPGKERLESLLRACRDCAPAQIVSRILDDVVLFAKDRHQKDDMTLLVAAVKDGVGQ